MSEVAMADLAARIAALGRFLLDTHEHERQPDPERPWLRRAAEPCDACRTLREALELGPARGETSA